MVNQSKTKECMHGKETLLRRHHRETQDAKKRKTSLFQLLQWKRWSMNFQISIYRMYDNLSYKAPRFQ